MKLIVFMKKMELNESNEKFSRLVYDYNNLF